MMQRLCGRIFRLAPGASSTTLTSSSASYCTDNNRWVEDDGQQRGDKTFVNRCRLVGNVGRDPEERGTDRPIVTLPIVTVNFFYPQDGSEPQKFKHWHRILVSGAVKREKVLRQIRKGDKIYVGGEIRQSKLVDGSSSCYIYAEQIMKVRWRDHTRTSEKAGDRVIGGILEGELDDFQSLS